MGGPDALLLRILRARVVAARVSTHREGAIRWCATPCAGLTAPDPARRLVSSAAARRASNEPLLPTGATRIHVAAR
jgi:hypothetical protein